MNGMNLTARILGKPFVSTEWDFVNPSPDVMESGFLMGAYASLQGWDGLCHFQIAGDIPEIKKEETRIGLFSIINDPIQLLSSRAGALFYLRGDVKTSETCIPLMVPRNAYDFIPMPVRKPEIAEKIGLICKTGSVLFESGEKSKIKDMKNIPTTLARTDWSHLLAEPKTAISGLITDSFENINVPFINRFIKKQQLTSSTGELFFNQPERTFKAVTPRSEGFILPEGKKLSGNLFSVSNRKTTGAFLFAARDGMKTLKESKRILILHLTNAQNSGQIYVGKNFTHMLTWGKIPLLMKFGSAEINIKDSRDFQLFACDITGKRLFEVPLQKTNDGWRFQAENFKEKTPVLVYELIAKEPSKK